MKDRIISSVRSSSECRLVHVLIYGRVQGVGYRAFVERKALDLGLRGWVRNRQNGCVEALFSGKSVVLSAMLIACQEGPTHAYVERIDQYEGREEDLNHNPWQAFAVLPTM